MTELHSEPGSFRDPATRVFYADDRVFRGLDETAAKDWAQLSGTKFFPELVAAGKAVRTEEVDASTAPGGAAGAYAAVLEHERIPFISYPYEWTFEMLRDAAILHLEILLAALEEDVTMKDGYAFNVQWRGARPSSSTSARSKARAGGPWIGYRQFCQTFLYPLLLEAHLGVPFQRILLGHLDGLDPTEMRRIFSGRKRFKKGVFRHVYLHSVAESRVTQGGQKIKDDLTKSGLRQGAHEGDGVEAAEARAQAALEARRLGLEGVPRDVLVQRRGPRREGAVPPRGARRHRRSSWRGTSAATTACTRASSPSRAGTSSRSTPTTSPSTCSTGRCATTASTNILPLVMNLVDPSPARGWRGEERRAFTDRGRARSRARARARPPPRDRRQRAAGRGRVVAALVRRAG